VYAWLRGVRGCVYLCGVCSSGIKGNGIMLKNRPDVEYRFFENTKLKSMAKDAIEPILDYLPFWVYSVIVDCAGGPSKEDPSSCASITFRPEYRQVQIVLYTKFFDTTIKDQQLDMYHELCHTFVAGLTEWVKRRLWLVIDENVKNNKQMNDILENEFQERVESIVQDMAYIFKNIKGINNEYGY